MREEAIAEGGWTLLSLLKVLKNLDLAARRPRKATSDRACLVLGNGPSLAEDLPRLDLHGRQFAVLSVNRFAESEIFESVRPELYVLADPAYWQADVSAAIRSMREGLYAQMKLRTTWPMRLVVPAKSRLLLSREFSGHPWITLEFFNATPVRGYAGFVHRMCDWGLGAPPAQNVLVAAVHVALCEGFGAIALLGADHSWHENLVVDAQGRVCLRDRHFYDPSPQLRPWVMADRDSTPFTMDQLFRALSEMFRGYWVLRRHAATAGVRIGNASSVSYVDAFERIAVQDVPAWLERGRDGPARA